MAVIVVLEVKLIAFFIARQNLLHILYLCLLAKVSFSYLERKKMLETFRKKNSKLES